HVVAGAVAKGLVTGHHVSQDGTLVRANCSFKSIEPIAVRQSPKQYREQVAKENPEPSEAESATGGTPPPNAGGSAVGRNPTVNFRGEPRRNETHRSKTDPDARLARRSDGQGAYPGYHVHYTMDNRSGLTLDVETTQAQDPQSGLRAVAAIPKADRGVVRRGEGVHGLEATATANPCKSAGATAADGAGAEPETPRQAALARHRVGPE